MDDSGLIERILRGTRAPNERPVDLLHMCLTAASARMAARSGRPATASEYYVSLEVVGEILCPIFSPVKPPDYQEAMMAARQQYAGIATNPLLQGAFAEVMMQLAKTGHLESLRRAIDGRIWTQLDGGAVA